jgi:hypothetical protein
MPVRCYHEASVSQSTCMPLRYSGSISDLTVGGVYLLEFSVAYQLVSSYIDTGVTRLVIEIQT